MKIANLALATAVLTGMLLCNTRAQNLVVNGNFETPVGTLALGPGSTDLTGWTIDASPPDGVVLGVVNQFATNGTQNLQLTGGAGSSTGGGISQMISTSPGQQYFVSIDLAAFSGGLTTGNLNFGGANLPLVCSNKAFITVTGLLAAASSSTLLDITGYSNSASQQLIIDNVFVSATNAPPWIVTQPQSVTNYAGNTTRFTVAARSAAPASYLWYYNTNTLVGTNATLVLRNSQNAGVYTAVVTNAFGSVTSAVANLTLLPNLAVNGDFEDPTLSGASQSMLSGSTNLVGWNIDATPPDGVQLTKPGVVVVNNGSQNLQLSGGLNYATGGGISQRIATTAGYCYFVSIDVARRQTADAPGNFRFGSSNYVLTTGSKTLTTLTWLVKAVTNSTLVDITGYTNSASSQTVIDNLIIAPAIAGPVDAGVSTVAVWQPNLAADGVSTSTITVTLLDSLGVPAPGKTVSLAQSSGSGTPVITAISAVTSGAGQATFTVKSTTPDIAVFTATDVTDNLVLAQTATVNFLAGSIPNADTSTVVAAPASVIADGITNSTITVTLKDVAGNPVSAKNVSLAQVSGPGYPAITTISGVSDVNGQAIFTVSSTTAGPVTFAATDLTDGIVVNQTVTVTFTAGRADPVLSTTTASPVSVAADGATASTITVTLQDAYGNPAPGRTVTLAKTSGPGTPVITTVSGTTDVNGNATFTATSVMAGTFTFTATDVSDAVVLSQTSNVAFTPVVVWGAPATIAGDTDVSTAGTLLCAEHWRGTDGTINGVPFTAAGVKVTKSDGTGNTQNLTWTNPGLSTSYYNILRGNWFQAVAANTFTVTNLVLGHVYQVQVWSVDRRSSQSGNLTLPGAPPVTLAMNPGQHAKGIFTAAFTSQTIRPSTVAGSVLNAVMVRDVTGLFPPTPAIMGISGPAGGVVTIHASTDIAGNVVTLRANSLNPPITWTPIQTNAAPGNTINAGRFDIQVPQGTNAQAFFRLLGQ